PGIDGDRSIQVLTHPATKASATVTISGQELSGLIDPCQDFFPPRHCFHTIWDTGTVSLTINGIAKAVTYNMSATASSIASSLASQFGDNGTVAVTSSGPVITIMADAPGNIGNSYTVSASSCTSNPDIFGGGSSCPSNPPAGSMSFSTLASGSTLTGGSEN